MNKHICFVLTVLSCLIAKADDKNLGVLGRFRACYDVKHYEIRVNVHPSSKSIDGSNKITIEFLNASHIIELNLALEMSVLSARSSDGFKIKFKRKGRVMLLELPKVYTTGEKLTFTIGFAGKPEIAKKAPWQGGFVWSKDEKGNDWVGLACESKGASVWLPCKDHWSDEPDSADMYLGVPKDLVGVSNGKLISKISTSDSFTVYHWKTLSPINHYDITINIGKYAHIEDSYPGIDGPLSKDYYVLYYNSFKAIKHFRETDTMLMAFEHFFGPYPFYKDGYKLVETPYWGMEHQSCVAYGNNYRYNRFGFDFIIVHESGHEWFANSITASDPADMWIHESFTTYSESLYVEYTLGMDSAISYLNMQRKLIKSRFPMQGPRDIDFHNRKDNDIYYKGTWVLHTLRNLVKNDSIWFSALRGMNENFKHKIIRTEDVTAYLNSHLMLNGNLFWQQYLYDIRIPELLVRQYELDGKNYAEFKFNRTVKGFGMELSLSKGLKINCTDKKSVVELNRVLGKEEILELRNRYLIEIKLI